MKVRNIVLSTSILLVLLSWTIIASAQTHSYGALRAEVQPDWVKPAPPVQPQDGWDDFVDHSANFPPIGNQGGQGSCTCWAVGYYYKTYQEWQERGWDLTDPDHQFSPAFIYNQINGGTDGGSYPANAFKLLTENGCAPYSVMPYTDQNCTDFPSEEAFYTGLPYRSQEVFAFNIYESLDGLKAHLLNGNVATFAFTVYANFDNISNYNNIYSLVNCTGDPRGGHAVCLTGFDDNLVTNDGVGAFKVANSWGASWGDAGYWWISYEAMQSPYVTWEYAHYCTDRIDYVPTTLAVCRVEHDDRYAVEFQFGVGSQYAMMWNQDFFDFFGNPHAALPFPATNIILDLTDATPYISPSGQNDFFMACEDSRPWNAYSGSIVDFSVVQLEWPTSVTSGETPVAIQDNGNEAVVNLVLEQGNSTPVFGTVSGTWDASGNPYYVTADITVPDGETLTIEAGAEILFLDNYSLDVGENAILEVAGTENDPVIFRPLLSAIGWKGITLDGSSNSSILQHCEIRYGKALGEDDEANGGGIYITGCNPTLESVLIENCSATLGGAIYIDDADPTITACTIQNNQADQDGAAIYVLTGAPQITNNTFINNEASFGAAIYLASSVALVEENSFTENSALDDGAGVHVEGGSPTVYNNSFIDNYAGKGGGVSVIDGTPLIDSNEFSGNYAGQGGAVYCNGSEVDLTSNTMTDNESPTGGAVYGIESTLNLTGNTISGNSSGNGGGVNLWLCTTELSDNQIVENSCTGFGGGVYLLSTEAELTNNLIGGNIANNGAGVYHINSSSVMINNTIARNEAGYSGGAVTASNNSSATLFNCIAYHNLPNQFFADGSSTLEAMFCDVEDSWDGEGNIDQWPMFISFTDYHLADWSPCIGAGVDAYGDDPVYYAPLTDLDGNSRPNPAGSNPDQGCYEHELGAPTAVEDEILSDLPTVFALYSAAPNPFNPATTVRFDLPQRALVNLKVYDITGRLVATLAEGWMDAGRHEAVFDAHRLASGVYIYRIQANDFVSSSKMVLVK